MKKLVFAALGCSFILGLNSLKAQSAQNEITKTVAQIGEEEEGPIMYQFEPDYVSAKTERRNSLRAKIRALDTLPISERKRLKLVKALYRDLNSEKFEKTILANTQFEDDEMDDDLK
ncbi:hypothetical protein ACOCEA_09060 [Maribacter sp. CXY002]|uniref:hypothetical protein n=1 Tax=Maribacter luteocoastalis TaxID=3407671 RepID=UPI003B677CC0